MLSNIELEYLKGLIYGGKINRLNTKILFYMDSPTMIQYLCNKGENYLVYYMQNYITLDNEDVCRILVSKTTIENLSYLYADEISLTNALLDSDDVFVIEYVNHKHTDTSEYEDKFYNYLPLEMITLGDL